jgi:hypothetical protein
MFSVKFRPPQQAPVQDTRDLLKAAICDVELATREQKASCCRGLRAIARSREELCAARSRQHIAKRTYLRRDIVKQSGLTFDHVQRNFENRATA